ncbi:MAG: RNB domain-containing ribonuclease, partial [Planctomycetaceae bacterium]
PEELGHYALAAEHYCHFTSPIRRYPDLLVHRAFDALTASHSQRATGPGPDELRIAGEHCSATERRAERAERELVKVKMLNYLTRRIGDRFSAVITGIAEYGFFCLLEEIPAEGLVHISTLDDDFYDFDRGAQAIIGRRSGRTHQLGEAVQVIVARVDVDRRQLDLRLAGSRAARQIESVRREGAAVKAPDAARAAEASVPRKRPPRRAKDAVKKPAKTRRPGRRGGGKG